MLILLGSKEGWVREPPKKTAFWALKTPQLVKNCRPGVTAGHRMAGLKMLSWPAGTMLSGELVVIVTLWALSCRLLEMLTMSLISRLLAFKLRECTCGMVIGANSVSTN